MSRTNRVKDHKTRRRVYKDHAPDPLEMRSCPQQKLSYRSERIAKQKAAIAWKTNAVVLSPYKCPHCHYWHLTSQV